MYLIVLTELNDVAQYLINRFVGRRKVLPVVSPGKTWVGFFGGVVTTLVLAILADPGSRRCTTASPSSQA